MYNSFNLSLQIGLKNLHQKEKEAARMKKGTNTEFTRNYEEHSLII